jgi:hypothetical protein
MLRLNIKKMLYIETNSACQEDKSGFKAQSQLRSDPADSICKHATTVAQLQRHNAMVMAGKLLSSKKGEGG